MDIASLCPLPIGVLAWRAPRPALSVIVKMTLHLSGSEPSLLDPQENLSLDRRSPVGAPHELLYASDFAPKKARCDVLLTGHARSEVPSRVIPARLRAGSVERRFFALAAEPSMEIPLSATYLRAGESASSGDVSVGPSDALAPSRAARSALASLDPNGLPLAPLPPDFDFTAFNAAPPEQQLNQMPVAIELDALLPGAPRQRIDFPSERPRVYAFVNDRGARPIREVPLRCDTLWIDTDRAICSLVFRGIIELATEGDVPRLALTLAPFGLPERAKDLERRLDGAPRVRAAEASDFRPSHAIDEETTSALSAKTPRAQGTLGTLGGMRLGGLRRAPDDDEKTTFRPIPTPRPGGDEAAEEILADELLEVFEVEEIEPEEDIADEPTPPSADNRISRPPAETRIQPPVLRRTTLVFEESTQTNFQIPQRAALPFEMDSSPGPDSTPKRPSYSDLPFQMASPPAVPPPPVDENTSSESSAAQSIPNDLPSALPFKPTKRRMTLLNPPVLPEETRAALPFVKAPSDPARDASPAPEAASLPPVLPFVKALPSAAPPSVPLVAPPDILSALPFTKPASRPPSDAPSPPLQMPSALPFVKSAPEPAPWAAPAPSSMSGLPFLAQLKPVDIGGADPPISIQKVDQNRDIGAANTKPLLPMETYAAVQVDLWDEGALLDDVLARHGIDEITWRDNERRRADALAEEAARGRSENALALAEAIEAAAARRALSDASDLPLDDYLAVRVALEGADEPEPVLARKNLSETKWQKLDQKWRKRAKSDAAVAKEIRDKLAELRKAAAAPPPPAPKPSPKRRKARSRAA